MPILTSIMGAPADGLELSRAVYSYNTVFPILSLHIAKCGHETSIDFFGQEAKDKYLQLKELGLPIEKG